jgi:hypothetical protein
MVRVSPRTMPFDPLADPSLSRLTLSSCLTLSPPLSSTALVPHRALVDDVGRRSNQGEHDTHHDTHHQR